MPAYDYVCPYCGNEEERSHPMNHALPVGCGKNGCPGVMIRAYRRAPLLHGNATPSRRKDTTSYREQ